MGAGSGDYVTPENLNSVMEFDHVIRVHADGLVTDERDTYAPELYDDDVSPGWTLLNGYSGQYCYSGPVMHPSEFIGGGMAKDILSEPGVYVALVASYSCEEHEDECECDTDEGWAVARKDDES